MNNECAYLYERKGRVRIWYQDKEGILYLWKE